MSFNNLRIGVLELQGDFAEHAAMVRSLGADTVGIREPRHLTEKPLDGLILPGGESTTIGKLLVDLGMLSIIRRLSLEHGLPIFGTCAGCILLSKTIQGHEKQPKLGLLEIVIDRNAYGPQIMSCETCVSSQHDLFKDDDGHAAKIGVVLIRAPQIVTCGKDVEVLAKYQDMPILVKEGNLLASTFHPELTMESRIHQLFLKMALAHKMKRKTAE